jgi:hypothetical protein
MLSGFEQKEAHPSGRGVVTVIVDDAAACPCLPLVDMESSDLRNAEALSAWVVIQLILCPACARPNVGHCDESNYADDSVSSACSAPIAMWVNEIDGPFATSDSSSTV